MANEKDAATRMSHMRAKMLLDFPWFGALALRLRLREDNNILTMATDGTRIIYNKDFVMSLPDDELCGVIIHEILHCALLHMYRIGLRDPVLANAACDLAINLIIKDNNIKLPQGALLDEKYRDMEWERIYALLQDEMSNGGGQPQDGSGATGTFTAPGGCAGDEDGDGDGEGGCDSGQPSELTEGDWKVAVAQVTAHCQKAGRMPAGVARVVEAAGKPEVDWRDVLRRFIENVIPKDFTWARPNRRFVRQGLYFPGILKENTARLVIAVDVSGSIGDDAMAIFASEMTGIMNDTRPEVIDVIYCDAAINKRVEFTPDDGEVRLEGVGGGGTAFGPVFDLIREEIHELGRKPACIIYLTDLYNFDQPEEIPDVPTLWVTSEKTSAVAPFGETVRLNRWQL